MWCRGTVTKLIPIKTKNKQKTAGPMRCRVCDIAVIEIFLIDFGSSEVFNFSRYVYSGSCSSAMLVLLTLCTQEDLCGEEILSQPVLLAQAADAAHHDTVINTHDTGVLYVAISHRKKWEVV